MTGSSGFMRAVRSQDELSTQKYYALRLNEPAVTHELGRFVGMSAKGATFTIMQSLVRQDRALLNVTIGEQILSTTVYEFGEET